MKALRACVDELLLIALTLFCGLMVAIGFVIGGAVWIFNAPSRVFERVRRG